MAEVKYKPRNVEEATPLLGNLLEKVERMRDGNLALLEKESKQEDFLEEEDTVHRLNPEYSSGVSSPGRHVRTRLYFTSESHIHSLLTVLCHGGLVHGQVSTVIVNTVF